MQEVVVELSNDPNWADIFSAIGQVAGAIFTAVAVGVALWIAIRDERRSKRQRIDDDHARANQEQAKAFAQAHLVRVDGAESRKFDMVDGQYRGQRFRLPVFNVSDRPIVNVRAEATFERDGVEILLAGDAVDFIKGSEHQLLILDAKSTDQFRLWRVRWMDPDGLAWQIVSSNDGVGFLGQDSDAPLHDELLKTLRRIKASERQEDSEQ